MYQRLERTMVLPGGAGRSASRAGQLLPWAAALALALAAPRAHADGLDVLRYAISGGTPNADARLRYETVDQDNLAEEASALTARLRLGYTTGKWNGLDLMVEYEGLAVLGDEDFNSTDNGRVDFPVVADPEGSEVNQAFIRYAGLPGTVLRYGRQRLAFDNQRFVGNVGWRQREQTYDGFSAVNTSLPKTTLSYAYVNNVKSFRSFTVNGKAGTDRDIEAHLLNVAYAPQKWLNLAAYAYLLDFEPVTTPPPPPDSATWGLRLTGAVPVDAVTLGYALEYATQQDHADATDVVDADYLLAEVGATWGKLGAKAGYELLGSNDGLYALQTPLATMHAHDGWADQFLATPATGLKRAYLSLGATVEKVVLTAVYHDFSADEGGADYGTEWDASATRPIIENFSVGLKYASYSADDFPVAGGVPFDTDKGWVWLEYKF